MASEYLYLYPGTHGEAVRLRETELWEKSFRENVACARAIEQALRKEYSETGPIPADLAEPVLKEYGFKRVNFVLASTILDLKDVPVVREQLDRDALEWAKGFGITLDSAYIRYYGVDTATVLLNDFVQKMREAYQALGLFDQSQCSAGMYDENVNGKVLVMKPSTLKEECWTQEDQLWLATGGFGCDPKASGRAIYATCLADGEQTRWNREDFVGVLDEQYLPEWAQEKLETLRAPTLEQIAAPTMGGMKMG